MFRVLGIDSIGIDSIPFIDSGGLVSKRKRQSISGHNLKVIALHSENHPREGQPWDNTLDPESIPILRCIKPVCLLDYTIN